MKLSFIKNGYWTIIRQKKYDDVWEVWIRFKSELMREIFDKNVNEMIDKGWIIWDVVVDTWLNLYIKMKKIQKSLF